MRMPCGDENTCEVVESGRSQYVYFAMRLFLQFCAFACVASVVHAQEVDLPQPAAQDPAASASPSPAPTPIAPPPDLIPPDILPAPDTAPVPPAPNVATIPQLDEGFKVGPINKPAEHRLLHAKWRKLRNSVENDPEIRAARVTAEKARTDFQKRKLLRRYYEMLYAKMSALSEPAFRPYLNDRKREALAVLPQPRVRPEPAPAPKKQP